MADSKTDETDANDPSLVVIDALDRMDVKALSYIQLRRLHAEMTHALDEVVSETQLRAENDNAGDTVRVPVPEKQEKES